jgi:hypothetical protein
MRTCRAAASVKCCRAAPPPHDDAVIGPLSPSAPRLGRPRHAQKRRHARPRHAQRASGQHTSSPRQMVCRAADKDLDKSRDTGDGPSAATDLDDIEDAALVGREARHLAHDLADGADALVQLQGTAREGTREAVWRHSATLVPLSRRRGLLTAQQTVLHSLPQSSQQPDAQIPASLLLIVPRSTTPNGCSALRAEPRFLMAPSQNQLQPRRRISPPAPGGDM